MFVKFTEKAQKALVMAESSAYKLGHVEVTTLHLLVALLKMPELSFCKALKQYMITDQKINDILKKQSLDEMPPYLEYSEELRELLDYAMTISRSKKVTADLLGYALIDQQNLAKEALQDYGVDFIYLKHIMPVLFYLF